MAAEGRSTGEATRGSKKSYDENGSTIVGETFVMYRSYTANNGDFDSSKVDGTWTQQGLWLGGRPSLYLHKVDESKEYWNGASCAPRPMSDLVILRSGRALYGLGMDTDDDVKEYWRRHDDLPAGVHKVDKVDGQYNVDVLPPEVRSTWPDWEVHNLAIPASDEEWFRNRAMGFKHCLYGEWLASHE